MKKICGFFCMLFLVFSCQKPSDCIETSGDFITKEVTVTPFTRIEVHQGIEIILKEEPTYKLTILTGENLMENIEIQQNGEILSLKVNSTCNWVRKYGQTKVYISAPNITEIYSKSEKNISSDGVLNYPILRLFALDTDGDGQKGAGTSDFILQCNSSLLEIHSNNVARFYISGTATTASFNLYFGDSRIEASNLIVNDLTVFHRSSNDILAFPLNSITGKIVSTGNVVLKNNPPIIVVEANYQGQLILH